MTRAEPKRGERIRQNIRLDKNLWDRIDQARGERPGSISRNTWITEAVLEKLERDVANARAGRVANA